MNDERPPNRISFFREIRGWTQQELAERTDAHWVTISKLERGKIKLTLNWMERLSKALSIDPGQLLFDADTSEAIIGIISKSGIVENRRYEDIEEWDSMSFNRSLYSDRKLTLWFAARDALYPPAINSRAILRFSFIVDTENITRFIGRICIVTTTNKRALPTLIGILHHGSRENLYSLDMPDGTVRRDAVHASDSIGVLTMVLTGAETPVDSLSG